VQKLHIPLPINRKTHHVCFGTQIINGMGGLFPQVKDIQGLGVRFNDGADVFNS
jgi:hypothetical protein